METLLTLNWVALVPLIIALTAGVKDLGAFKKMNNQLVNLIVAAAVIGLIFLAQAVGFDWVSLAPFQALVVLVINPVVYDKVVKPLWNYLIGSR